MLQGLHRPIVKIAALLAFTLLSPCASAQATTPNIILIVADDMGWGDSSAYNPDSKIPLSNIAQLAQEGVRFDRAYTAAAKCAPTRYSFLSGNYHWKGRGPFGWWKFFGGSQVLPGQDTIANVLQGDYDTSVFGKYHLGGHFYKKDTDTYMQADEDPLLADLSRPMENGAASLGFDYSYILLRGIQEGPYVYFENDQITTPAEDLVMWELGAYGYSRIIAAGMGAPDYDSSEVGPTFANRAIEHLEQLIAQPNPKPFFLYYPAVAVHAPNTPPDYFNGIPIRNTQFAKPPDMLYQLDHIIGQFMTFLDDNNLAQDTLIIVTSDNGAGTFLRPQYIENFGHDVNGGLKGGKADIWDGGVRIPLIMRWGDGTAAGSTLPPGTVNNRLFALQDIPATITAIVDKTPDYQQMKDSYNMLENLTNPSGVDVIRQSLVLQSKRYNEVTVPPFFGLVENDWKLVLDGDDVPREFYDMQADSIESNNLVESAPHQVLIDELREKLLLLRDAEHTAPIPNMVSKPAVPSGKPTLELVEEGIFVWGDSSTGVIEIDIKSRDGEAKTGEVEILSNLPFQSIEGRDLEQYKDLVQSLSDRHVFFRGFSKGYPDGLRARLAPGAFAVVKVTADSDIANIRFGEDKIYKGNHLFLNNNNAVTEVLAPGIDGTALAGDPALAMGDTGVFIWTISDDGAFEVRVKGDGGSNPATTLQLVADSPFESVTAQNLGPGDSISWAGDNKATLQVNSDNEARGITAKLPAGSSFFAISMGPNGTPNIWYGPEKTAATPNSWYLPISQLQHDGVPSGSKRLENFSVGPGAGGTGNVAVRWKGLSAGSTFHSNLVFDQPVTGVQANEPLNALVRARATPNGVQASSLIFDVEGGLDIQAPGATELGLYFHNANGQTFDYLANLPTGLGAPNAHRVKLAEPAALPPGC